MTMYGFKQGTCQAVLTDISKTHVFKVPLTRKYDQKPLPNGLNPKNVYRRFLKQRRYTENVKRFKNSIRILQKLEQSTENQLEQFFPHTEIFFVENIEHFVGKKLIRYSGPIIKQELVPQFFGNNICFNCFAWEAIPKVQIELWKYGVGIGAPADIWGPKNWGLTGSGAVRLADTSHITEDFDLIMRLLEVSTLENRKTQVLKQNEVSAASLIEQYFEFMRQKINAESLSKYWRQYL